MEEKPEANNEHEEAKDGHEAEHDAKPEKSDFESRHALFKQESTHFDFLRNPPPHAEKSGSDVCVRVGGHEHGCGAALSPALHSRP